LSFTNYVLMARADISHLEKVKSKIASEWINERMAEVGTRWERQRRTERS
jgi:hypothetical protein